MELYLNPNSIVLDPRGGSDGVNPPPEQNMTISEPPPAPVIDDSATIIDISV